MNTVAPILKEYFAKHGIRNREISEKLGISRSSVSNMLSGHDCLGYKRAVALQEHFGLSARHLLAGEVVELPKPSQDTTPTPPSAEIAALRAENTQLRQQVEWLRGIIENSVKK